MHKVEGVLHERIELNIIPRLADRSVSLLSSLLLISSPLLGRKDARPMAWHGPNSRHLFPSLDFQASD